MKFGMEVQFDAGQMSPSMRREWIEMSTKLWQKETDKLSPSMRREWIEISVVWNFAA